MPLAPPKRKAGRPPTVGASATLQIRVPPAALALFDAEARLERIALSVWVRDTLLVAVYEARTARGASASVALGEVQRAAGGLGPCTAGAHRAHEISKNIEENRAKIGD